VSDITDTTETITLNTGDIDDIADILGRVCDFLVHGDADATGQLRQFLAGRAAPEALASWIAELGSRLFWRLSPGHDSSSQQPPQICT
jgi:hypothetical protein